MSNSSDTVLHTGCEQALVVAAVIGGAIAAVKYTGKDKVSH